MADRDATWDLIARDRSAAGTNSAIRNARRLKRATDDSSKSSDRLEKAAKKLGTAMLGAAKATGRVVATVSAVAAAFGPLTVGLIAGAKAAVAFGKATARMAAILAPLVAFLPSLAGSAGLLFATFKLAGPGLAKALKPISDFFALGDKKGKGVGSLTSQLRKLIAVGVEPLAKQFAKVNLPVIAAGMDRVAVATNGVVRATGSWLNTLEGQKLIATITNATATAMEKLGPKVSAAAIAVGRLANRAGDKAITGFADLIGRILDKFTAWANGTSVDDINASLDKLKDMAGQARDKLKDMQAGLQWLIDHQGQIKAVSNVLAGIAVVFGVATGNWGAAIAGAAVLVINNFGSIKKAVTDTDGSLQTFVRHLAGDPKTRQFFDDQIKALQGMRQAWNDATKDISQKWSDAIAKIKAAWQTWEPIIHIWWVQIGQPLFKAIGATFGTLASVAVGALGNIASDFNNLGIAIKKFVMFSLNVLGTFINGAAAAFGWIPGIGPKLNKAAADFDAFKNRVNSALEGIKDRDVNVNVHVSGLASASDAIARVIGSAKIASGIRARGFASTEVWEPARFAAQFAGGGSFAGGSGGSRIGGPVEVHSDVDVAVLLDGKPFMAIATRVAAEETRRSMWRQRGRR
jgi:soluble cytochrome b562